MSTDNRTGWPPGMLQDDSRELSRALASTPGARLHASEAARYHQVVDRGRDASIGTVCVTAPERIWLQVDPEPEEAGQPVYSSTDEVTWCSDRINESDTLYIRADLAAAPAVAPQPVAAEPAVYQFEVWMGDEFCASGDAPTMEEMRAEASRYAAGYAQDGAVTVLEFVRHPLSAPPQVAPTEPAGDGNA